MISRQRMTTISCHNRKPMQAAVQAVAGDNQRIEVELMDKLLYAQVLITCTTINLFGLWIADKLYDRRKRKKKEREEQAAKTEEAAQ